MLLLRRRCLDKVVKSNGLSQFFLGGCQHQLNPVKLVDLAGAWIVVYGYDIGAWICLAKLLDNTLADNVVWQASKRLCTDDIRHAGVD